MLLIYLFVSSILFFNFSVLMSSLPYLADMLSLTDLVTLATKFPNEALGAMFLATKGLSYEPSLGSPLR